MSIWQTWNWEKLVLKSNQAVKVFEIENIKVEKRSIWFGLFWFFIFGISKDCLNENILNKLKEISKKEKVVFAQIEILDYENIDSLVDFESLFILNWFNKWYYKKFITPYTVLIDLTIWIEEIYKRMKPKWRYNIKLALKKWVQVFEAEKTSENIKIFYDLMVETTKRDWFFGNKFDYYKDFLEYIENSSLVFTKFEDKILSAWIFVFDKDVSIYYYWASTSDLRYRNLMAPYLMQDFAIRKSVEVWSKYYDFLWVATPWDTKSSLKSVTDFKMKFTQDIRKVSESYIYVNKKFLYFFIIFVRFIKKNIF